VDLADSSHKTQSGGGFINVSRHQGTGRISPTVSAFVIVYRRPEKKENDMAVVEYETRDHIAIITMNRPERHNAMSRDLFLGLAECWQRFAADEEARVAILIGTGNSFCAGMDIKERLASGEPGLGLPKIPIRDPFWFEELEKPTVAAINGYALGGGFFLASRADFRIAVPSALFQITEVVRGNIAGYEAVLTRENLPYAIAAELAAGSMLTAERLYQVGFLNRLTEPGRLLETAITFATELTQRPPLAVDYHLRLLRSLSRMPLPEEVAEQARHYSHELQQSEDLKEALRAFIERRVPVFRGR
jgi:enoyl-CoA hydratase/carnithine racemase